MFFLVGVSLILSYSNSPAPSYCLDLSSKMSYSFSIFVDMIGYMYAKKNEENRFN